MPIMSPLTGEKLSDEDQKKIDDFLNRKPQYISEELEELKAKYKDAREQYKIWLDKIPYKSKMDTMESEKALYYINKCIEYNPSSHYDIYEKALILKLTGKSTDEVIEILKRENNVTVSDW